MKRFLSIILALAMLLSLASTVAFAEEPEVDVQEPGSTEGDDFDVGFGELVDPVPGATPENPIIIGRADWTPVELVDGTPVVMTYTATVPYGATYYYASSVVGGYEIAIGEGEAFTPEVDASLRMAAFSITNNDETATEIVVTATMPLGTMANPERIEEFLWTYTDTSVAAGDTDGYYYIYNAPAAGTVTLYFNEVPSVLVEDATYDEEDWELTPAVYEDYICDIVVTKGYTTYSLLNDGVDNYGLELQIPVESGEELIIQIIAVEDTEGNRYPEADMTWVGQFAYPVGTEQNPINVEWTWDDNYSTATAEITAEGTQWFTGIEGMILTIDGTEAEMFNGMFTLTEGTHTVVLSTPVGAQANPEVIEEMDGYTDTVALEENGAYYYIWTATEDGTVILDVTDGANINVDHIVGVSEDGWPVSVQYVLAEPDIDENWNYVGWIAAENLTIEVKAGEQLKIQVNGLTDWANWTTPAVEYTLTGAFESDAGVVYDVRVRSYDLGLESEILMTIKFTAPEELINDDNAYIVTTLAGNEKRTYMPEIRENGTDAKGYYSVYQGIASGYMTKDVVLTAYSGKDVQCTVSTSKVTAESWSVNIMTYVKSKMNNASTSSNLKALIASMLVYGGYAQNYFIGSNSKIDADPIYNELAQFGISVPDISGISIDTINRTVIKGDTTFPVQLKSIDVGLESAVYMNVGFEIPDAAADKYTFTLYRPNGSTEDLVPTQTNGNRFAVVIEDIAAAYFGHDYTIRVTDNETGEYNEVGVSVYAFLQIKMKNTKTSIELYQLCQAIYYYSEKAYDYFILGNK